MIYPALGASFGPRASVEFLKPPNRRAAISFNDRKGNTKKIKHQTDERQMLKKQSRDHRIPTTEWRERNKNSAIAGRLIEVCLSGGVANLETMLH